MSVRYAVIVFALVLAACGYHLPGEQSGLPDDVRSLSVGTIGNQSREHGLEKSLAFALEREIHVRRHFRMVEDPGGGDAVLTGAIRELSVRPVAFDENDQAVQYEMALRLDLTLTRQSDGRVLWRVTDLRESEEYSALLAVVVTSSSQFQQGTLDAADLRNPRLNRIQLAGSERQRAVARLLSRVVRDAYNQMVENF